MKGMIFKSACIAAISTILLFSFRSPVQLDAATVNQYQGIYVFTDCRPSAEYTVMGTVKPKGRGLMAAGLKSTQYSSMRNALIKAAKEQYPDCNGVILNLSSSSMDECSAIKLR